MSQSRLADAAKQAREGHITRSLEILQQEVQKQLTHALASNLAALYLQLGDKVEACNYATKAVTLDPYSYIGYYNRFLCYFNQDNLRAKHELDKALSCLYLLIGLTQNNVKLLNKSISYCQQNAKAYLFRAKLNQGKNKKLAQNDYSAALEYDQNLAQIYQQRALFYRRIGKVQQFQKDCVTYIRLKQQNASIQELVDNEENQAEYDLNEKIEEEVRQFQGLLARVQSKKTTPLGESTELVSKLPLSGIQSKIDRRQDEQLLLSDRPDPEGSTQTITIRKEEIQFKKKSAQQGDGIKYKDLFEDECSGQLDERINKIEKQIQQKGGKILTERKDEEELDLSDPTNFLTEEIEKAIFEIGKLSSPDTLNEVRSVKSAGSQGSKLSVKELTVQQFSKFHTAKVEIVYLQDLQDYKKKQIAKVQLKYGQKTVQTGMSKYEWRESFSFNLFADYTQIDVTVIEKGGIFRSDHQICQGTINLLETGNVKCILGNKEKKVAILYFKVHLS